MNFLGRLFPKKTGGEQAGSILRIRLVPRLAANVAAKVRFLRRLRLNPPTTRQTLLQLDKKGKRNKHLSMVERGPTDVEMGSINPK